MGVFVGMLVGPDVGVLVGDFVGDLVGFIVGDLLGLFVGGLLGDGVGLDVIKVGVIDGVSVLPLFLLLSPPGLSFLFPCVRRRFCSPGCDTGRCD